jgi:nicotinamide riboside transporter PnuC
MLILQMEGCKMLISYIAAIFSLTGIWFNIKKNPICWFLFMASDSLWFTYSVFTHQWAISITHTFFVFANFYGMYIWSKAKNGKDAGKNQ